ncbi:putative snf7 family protein [Phaeomoniella chlamydospora]|uniref:Putative snf7 family protein n=1 Tax=Phaeomoniella chlamydospora TaxID=158046 RepID=A0A0G2GWR1_PHACM|nr:putative snf7 family protein [Phaeomoniella chlamydospora]
MSALLNWILEHENNFRKARLPSLYSDFSVQKVTNPDGFAANVAAWQTALSHALKAGAIESTNGSNDVLVLQTNENLIRELENPQFGRPLGLSLVLDDAVQKGIMIPIQDFKNSQTSIYSTRWIPSPWQVFNWGLRQIGFGHAYSGQKLQVGSLVIIANVEDIAAKVLSEMQKRSSGLTDRVMAVESFKEDLTKILGLRSVSTTDLSVLLKYLQRDKAAISYDDKVNPSFQGIIMSDIDEPLQTIKFKAPSSTKPEPLTTQDATIASLKLLISNLSIQCAALSDKVTSLSSTARQAVKNGNRVSAQQALRSRKLAESTFSQRSATLHQLEEVYSNIEQAVDQVEVISVMEASASTLKGLNKQIGGVERVEDIIEDLRVEMGKVDEIGHVINEPLTDQAVIDEDELDNELEAMEKEQKDQERNQEEAREAEAMKERLEEAGRVPTDMEKFTRISTESAEQDMDKAANRLSGMSLDEEKESKPEGPDDRIAENTT